MLAELDAMALDAADGWFQPSNLEITDLSVNDTGGNPPAMSFPRAQEARLSIRFNDWHTGKGPSRARVRHCREARGQCPGDDLGRALPDPPGVFRLGRGGREGRNRVRSEPSTTGGTSDARFLRAVCPVLEFGLVNATCINATRRWR